MSYLLLREFGCKPPAAHWFMAAVRLWNKVAKMWLNAAEIDCPSDLLVSSRTLTTNITGIYLAMQLPIQRLVQ